VQLIAYLTFNGECEAAFKFYEKCLGGKIAGMWPYAGSPMENQVPAERRNKLMHATLLVGEAILQGADVPPGGYQKPQGISVSINLKGAAQAERIFQALSENGTVQWPLQETFWAVRFGVLVDRFGIPWMINCEEGAGS
jgi:PhnB protein